MSPYTLGDLMDILHGQGVAHEVVGRLGGIVCAWSPRDFHIALNGIT
jgi:hypothetical protein